MKDLKLNFEWRKSREMYQPGESLYLNNIQVGNYYKYWNNFKTQTDKDPYRMWRACIDLPSFREPPEEIYGETPGEIKSKIEDAVTSWFQEALK